MAQSRKNKDFNPNNCPVTHFLNKIGGKWKTLVLYAISKNYNRFSMLQKVIPMISKQMLINQLRELEEDGIIERTIFAEIPPRVEYKLTDYGQSLMPIILTIQDWGIKDLQMQAKG
ncbi:winged helix-turn-helix transcriptional regulator [Dyadobacter subterraneus]|uniref:Helix-turn-helix transcriptional regulator n=1 Tax=Dyadobacter subterraneus TaxID=2773304 RepID=A0ABR9W537_9BACT|nr:helix-turn-helix domain-containing protein [Dyadobacter subterraneus]MBE9460555.1 helix-turn-helix transcriptional regulator [Dyadobacter subterraneus]